MEEPPQLGDNAILVHLNFPDTLDPEDEIAEFTALARSSGAEVVGLVEGSRQTPDPKYFVGTGKAEEIREVVTAAKADLVLINHSISPAQERNLERLIKCRVLDRSGLILDIFAQRAHTFEGKLQVELAQLRHLSTRLVRGWTHLERQKGGIGLRGPGETQLETDRRLIRHRIQHITSRLEKVRRQRALGRQSRQKRSLPTVSLVGYTNAGKSTLFNALTEAEVYVQDQLFATLDPTLKAIKLPKLGKVIMADTVGFIRHLPHTLIEAFRATLEETSQAQLLLHVIDASDDNRKFYQVQVDEVLKEIEAERLPQLLVFNKIDKLSGVEPKIDRDDSGRPVAVWISADQSAGLSLLQSAMIECLAHDMISLVLELSQSAGSFRASLYELGAVRSESVNEAGHWVLHVMMLRHPGEQLMKKYQQDILDCDVVQFE